MQEENIVKKACKELGVTYKELSESIGVAEGTIKQNAVKEDVSEQLKKAIELLIENNRLKAQEQRTQQLKLTLQELLK